MRTLVIDTATAACSVALIDDGAVVAHGHEVVGRGHAERLLPMIAALPDGGRADRVLVDCGPGSFTGVRVGLAAALAFGLAWRVPVSGYSSTALIAAGGLSTHRDRDRITVVMEGGHGELFVQPYAAAPALHPTAALASLRPEAAVAALRGHAAIGSGVRWLPHDADLTLLGEALPDARQALLLPGQLTELAARPIYGRAPDAKPMAGA